MEKVQLKTLQQNVDDLRHFAANPQQRVRTGFESLDYYIEGPAAGEVCTIIGRSYTGKSLLATQIMANHEGGGSIFFSLEMTRRQAMTRLFSQWANIDAERVRAMVAQNKIDPRIDDMAQAMNRHVIIDQSGLSVGDMAVYIEQYERTFGNPPDFVLIDYLERVGGIKASAEGWQAVEGAADQVKDLAKGMNLPVFLFHQTNRSEPEHEPPTERSARGGGFTEADFVIGMWAPARDPRMPPFKRQELWNIIRMNVLKNRHSGNQNQPWKPLEFERLPSLRIRDLSMEQTKFEMAYTEAREELEEEGVFDEDENDFDWPTLGMDS